MTLIPWLSNSTSSGRTSSAYSTRYARPEQPDVRTPRRKPTPLPRFAKCAATCFAAVGVSFTPSMSVCRSPRGFRRCGFRRCSRRSVRVSSLVIGDRRLDGVFGEDGAMNLHGWQRELLGDLRVLDGECFVERLALHPFGHERRRRNRRTAAVCLEFGVLDDAVLADLDLQLHHVAAGRRADHAGTHALFRLRERTDVARILVVIND